MRKFFLVGAFAVVALMVQPSSVSLGAQLQVPQKITFHVLDLAPDGMVLARISPPPFVVAVSDKPLKPGETLTCTVENGYLDCGEAIIKPQGFMIHAESPELRVQQGAQKQRSQ